LTIALILVILRVVEKGAVEMDLKKNKEKVLKGEILTVEEVKSLFEFPLENVLSAAEEIRKHYLNEEFDTCSIMNVKSGLCSEDCTYCAQSKHYNTKVEVYPLASKEEILKCAKENENAGVNRFSLVSSGRDLSAIDEKPLFEIYQYLIENTNIKICASHGILEENQAKLLKDAGVMRYHHNLESSENFYKEICTTHSYQDRINTIVNAQKAGLEVCSGGIIGLGESLEDRIELAMTLKKLQIKSIPLNFLMAIPGTPLGKLEKLTDEEIYYTVAMFRFVNPTATIRYAGGRSILTDLGRLGISGGVNGALVGNLLTTVGNTIQEDLEMIKSEYKK
jgi:biotin synthase